MGFQRERRGGGLPDLERVGGYIAYRWPHCALAGFLGAGQRRESRPRVYPSCPRASGVFYKAAGDDNSSQPVPQVKFSLKEGGDHLQGGLHLRSQAIVMFSPEADLGRGRLDAVKLASLNAEYLSLYTTGTDGNALDINALPGLADSSRSSAIKVDMDLDGSALGGEYTLAWSPEALPVGWSATLSDT